MNYELTMDLTQFLPIELLLMIMSNFDHKSLNNLNRTNHLFNDLCHDVSFLKQKKWRFISQFDLEKHQNDVDYLMMMARCFSNTLTINEPYGDYLLEREETHDEIETYVMVNGTKFVICLTNPFYFKVRVNNIEIKRMNGFLFSITKYDNDNKKKVFLMYEKTSSQKHTLISAKYYHNEKLEFSSAEYNEREKCYILNIKNFDPKYRRKHTTVKVDEQYLEFFERSIMNRN